MARMFQPIIDEAKEIITSIETDFNSQLKEAKERGDTEDQIKDLFDSFMTDEIKLSIDNARKVICRYFDLGESIVEVMKREPYYTAFSRQIPKIKTMAVPTMGVGINPSKHKPFLLYNPVFSAFLTNAEIKDVVEHEFLHVVLGHITTRKPDDPQDHDLHNQGMDLAINEYLPHLPITCLRVGQKDQPQFKDFPEKMNGEVYIELLRQQRKEEKEQSGQKSQSGQGQSGQESQSGQGQEMTDSSPEQKISQQSGQVDEHSTWQEMSDGVKKDLSDKIANGDEKSKEIQKATGMDESGKMPN